MVWTDEKVTELTKMWEAGRSITQIGKALGLTRNAVVGKAHRLGLSKRPSPIIRTAPKPQPYSGPRCKWPIGDPKTAEFGFCNEPALTGKPYCESHCAMAYNGWTNEEQKSEKAA